MAAAEVAQRAGTLEVVGATEAEVVLVAQSLVGMVGRRAAGGQAAAETAVAFPERGSVAASEVEGWAEAVTVEAVLVAAVQVEAVVVAAGAVETEGKVGQREGRAVREVTECGEAMAVPLEEGEADEQGGAEWAAAVKAQEGLGEAKRVAAPPAVATVTAAVSSVAESWDRAAGAEAGLALGM